MSTTTLTYLSRPFLRVQPSCRSLPLLPTADKLFFIRWGTPRTYSSGQTSSSSLLTSALDRKQKTSYSGREDSVGLFQLGISQAALKRGEKAKRWSELTTSGKVLRTTQRTTSFTVILLGAGLSVVLVYALTSELFSKNSPTVLYNDACGRVKASLRVAKYLHAPLTFHNNLPSVVRPRHRHRHVASQIAIDSSGREHLLLNFYVQGSSSTSLPMEDEKDNQWASYVESLASLTFEDLREKMSPFIDSARSAFKYLRGDAIPSTLPTTTVKEKIKDQERTEEYSWWGLTRLFSGLRGRSSYDGGGHGVGITWTEGEVHADLVRTKRNRVPYECRPCYTFRHCWVRAHNDEGYFVFRYLLIDIPNSESRNPIRVFVERAPGVRENEPIVRFHSS